MKHDLLTPEEAEIVLSSKDGCGLEPNSPDMTIGKVLLFSAWVGEDIPQLSIVSGLPETEVFAIAEKLTHAGVFGSGDDHAADYLGDSGGLCLSLDVSCGMGQLRRGDDSTPANQTWQMTEAGLDHVERELLPRPEAQALMDSLDKENGMKPGTWRSGLDKRRKKQ